MGCVSSKSLKQLLFLNSNNISNGNLPNSHVVSLTSSTYGALKLDPDLNPAVFSPKTIINNTTCSLKQNVEEEKIKCQLPEVINTWELMSDLEDEKDIHVYDHVSINKKDRSPFRRLANRVSSPVTGVTKFAGKENIDGFPNQSYITPKERVMLIKGESFESPRRSISGVLSSSSRRRRRSLGPLFDPGLIESFEKELSREAEARIEEKCPPGGEHCVVIYTTTLRGIRKTFEDCNVVRTVMKSYHIRVIERDISMDSGFKEELRKLMGTKEVIKLPSVFVKGRLIGGANEVVKLDEDGQLEGMLQGICKAVFRCQGCGDIRFVMCSDCNGSCKVLDRNHRSMVRCGGCNENGLIRCPLCS